MGRAFEAGHEIDKEIDSHLKLFKSAAGRLNFNLSENFGIFFYHLLLEHHVNNNQNQRISELEAEIEKLREKQLDYQLLEQNYEALQAKYNMLEEMISTDLQMEKDKKHYESQRKLDMEKSKKL